MIYIYIFICFHTFLGSCSDRLAILKAVSELAGSFASVSGGNMVNGLPPAFSLDRQNFGPTKDFSIFISLGICRGKFIFARTSFPGSLLYYKVVLLKFHVIWSSQCRERAQERFEMMENILRNNDEIRSKNIFRQRT